MKALLREPPLPQNLPPSPSPTASSSSAAMWACVFIPPLPLPRAAPPASAPTRCTPAVSARLGGLFRRRRRPHAHHDWASLVDEFEQRAAIRAGVVTPRTDSELNEAQYEMLPYVEAACMTALTTMMWFMGRIYRLDALFLLMYPLPSMYVAARHGLRIADATFFASVIIVSIFVGPIYTVLYVLNTGLITLCYARALCYRLGWFATFMALGAAKTVALALQIAFFSSLIRFNSWRALNLQVVALLGSIAGLLKRVGVLLPTPSSTAVSIAMATIVALHSFYHIFFTQLSATLILKSINEHSRLDRVPPDMPLVRRFMRARRSKRR